MDAARFKTVQHTLCSHASESKNGTGSLIAGRGRRGKDPAAGQR